MQFAFHSHVGAEQRKLAAEEEAEIEFGVVAGGAAAGDQTAGEREAGEAVVPGGGADVLEDDVDAALVGDAANFVANFLRFVIDHVIGAELECFFELCVGTGGCDDAGAEEFRDLDGCGA